MKRIYKYATGDVIPEGAVYMGTIVQRECFEDNEVVKCHYVWHYFLVEVEQ